MKSTRLVAALLAAILVATAVSAAEPTAVERAIAAANAAAAAAVEAERAAQAAKDAAELARKAAENAKAAAIAAGFRDASSVTAVAKPNSAPNASPSPSAPASGAGGKDEQVVTGVLAYVTANTEGGNATIKYQRKREYENSGGSVSTYTISSPLAAGSKSTDVATLDGLGNGANVGYAWNRYVAASDAISPDIWMIGMQGRLGYKKFKYFNSSSLAEASVDRYSKSLAPFVGYQVGSNLMFLGKFDYQRAYKDADAKVLCPLATTFPVACVNGPAGEPKLTTKRISSLTVRYTTAPVNGEVTLSYDQASKVKGIDLPFYFIQSKEGDRSVIPFNAGVRLGWRSDTRDASVGLFVGSPFVFFGP